MEERSFKKDNESNINMLLMVKKGITGGICHYIYQYSKASNKYMKDCDKYKES